MEVQKREVSFQVHATYISGWLLGRAIEILRFVLLISMRWSIQFTVGIFRLISGWLDLFMRQPIIALVVAGVSVTSAFEVLQRLGIKF